MMNNKQECDSSTDDDDNQQCHDRPQVAVTVIISVIPPPSL